MFKKRWTIITPKGNSPSEIKVIFDIKDPQRFASLTSTISGMVLEAQIYEPYLHASLEVLQVRMAINRCFLRHRVTLASIIHRQSVFESTREDSVFRCRMQTRAPSARLAKLQTLRIRVWSRSSCASAGRVQVGHPSTTAYKIYSRIWHSDLRDCTRLYECWSFSSFVAWIEDPTIAMTWLTHPFSIWRS